MRCFKCGEQKTRQQIWKGGKRKNGSRWFLCKECRRVELEMRKLDNAAARAADDDWTSEQGWNGIPSDASIRRRSQ